MVVFEKDTNQETQHHSLRLLLPDIVKKLSTLKPWKTLMAIILQWASIIIAIWLSEKFWHPLLLIVVIIWIASRQHALAVLIHEGAHRLIIKNKFINDVITELLLAWPVFISMRFYRFNHMKHHRYLNSDFDPDWVRITQELLHINDWKFPKKTKSLASLLFKDFFAINTITLIATMASLSKNKAKDSAKVYTSFRIVYYVIAVSMITSLHVWHLFFIYWIIPMLTWLALAFRIRSIAEHCAVKNTHPLSMTRTTYANMIERVLIAPFNVGYHLDHHIYPSIPFYNLKKLHSELLKNKVYEKNAHVTKTYMGVLKECVE